MLSIWGHLLSWEPDRPSRATGITAFRRREEGRSPPSRLATDLFEDGVSRRPGVLRQCDRRLWTMNAPSTTGPIRKHRSRPPWALVRTRPSDSLDRPPMLAVTYPATNPTSG